MCNQYPILVTKVYISHLCKPAGLFCWYFKDDKISAVILTSLGGVGVTANVILILIILIKRPLRRCVSVSPEERVTCGVSGGARGWSSTRRWSTVPGPPSCCPWGGPSSSVRPSASAHWWRQPSSSWSPSPPSTSWPPSSMTPPSYPTRTLRTLSLSWRTARSASPSACSWSGSPASPSTSAPPSSAGRWPPTLTRTCCSRHVPSSRSDRGEEIEN